MPLVEAGVEAAPLCPAPVCDDEAALAGLAAADFPPAGDDPEPDPVPALVPVPVPLPDPLPDFPLPLPDPDPLSDPLPDFPLPLPDPDPLPDPLPDFPLPPDLLLPASDAFVLLSGGATLPDFVFDELWAG